MAIGRALALEALEYADTLPKDREDLRGVYMTKPLRIGPASNGTLAVLSVSTIENDSPMLLARSTGLSSGGGDRPSQYGLPVQAQTTRLWREVRMYTCRFGNTMLRQALAQAISQKRATKTLCTVTIGALVFVSLLPTASASPIGNLQIATCGGVNVNGVAITFLGPPGGLGQAGYGCITTSAGGVGTGVTYSGGTLGATPPVLGEIKSLTFGVTPGTDFMDFTGNGNLIFDLAGFLAGPSNTNCSTLALFDSCGAVGGSPFVLSLQPGGTGACPVGVNGGGNNCQTSVTLNIATSMVRDLGNGTSSLYTGNFTTQITTLSPSQIQSSILSGGTVGSGASGSFTLTAVPEPMTYGMLGAGLFALALMKKRKARSS